MTFRRPARARGIRSLASLALALAATFIAGCTREEARPAPPPEVVVETVTRRDLPLTLTYPAHVSGSRVVEVRARVSGRIVERLYTEGQPVRADELLFRIDPEPYKAAYDEAAAQVAVARANIAKTENDFARADALVKEGAVSRREFEQAQAALAQARATLAAAEAAARAARLNLEYTEVRAPVAGIASKEAVTIGNLVNGSGGASGDLLTSIVQSDPAYVEFSMPEPEYLRLRDLASVSREGLSARIERGSSCRSTGRVDFTDAFVNRATGTIRARAVFPNPQGCLVSGQYLTVAIEGMSLPNSIAVPKAAVIFGQAGPMAWVVGQDDTVQPRPLQIRESWLDGWIVEGLQPGERVIVEGVLKVAPGAKVVAAAREPDGERSAATTPGRSLASTEAPASKD